MMKKIYISFLFSLSLVTLNAQQVALLSHAFYQPMLYNPAFTGSSDKTNAMIISRSQWIDFKNAPRLNVFTLDGSSSNKKMGFGIDLYSDKKGISNKIGGDLYYAYRLKLGENAGLTFGIAAGLMDHTLHYSEAVLENNSDPSITGASQRKTTLNANAGISFTWKDLAAGVSVPQLLGNAVEYQDNVTGSADYALSRYYAGSLKYRFLISNEKQISLTPLMIINYIPNAPFKYDANLNAEWKDKLWIGATYKSDYAISANAGFCISKQFYVGYSYDFIIGNIGKYSGMSHEVMLNFVFGQGKHHDDIAAEPTVTAAPANAKADSLQTELEIKDNKIKSEADAIQSLNQQLAKAKEENEAMKKNAVAPQNDNNNATSGNGQIAATPANGGNIITSGTAGNQQTNDHPNTSTQKSGPSLNTNQNSAALASSANKVMENGVWIMSGKINDHNHLNDSPSKTGFYVITGTFFYRDLALADLERIKRKGNPSAEILYSFSKKFNYIAASFYSSKDMALKQAEKLKASGEKDAWILSLQP